MDAHSCWVISVTHNNFLCVFKTLVASVKTKKYHFATVAKAVSKCPPTKDYKNKIFLWAIF